MEIVEKKQYPSQINSKTISARVPVQDYVNFLNESIELGISLNDFLLRKIYSNKSLMGIVNNQVSNNYDKELIPDETINFINNFPFDICPIEGESSEQYFQKMENMGVYNNPINDTKEVNRIYIKSLHAYFYTLKELVNALEQFGNMRKKTADLMDVKNQLTILIQNTFEDINERKTFRKEIYELLKELE